MPVFTNTCIELVSTAAMILAPEMQFATLPPGLEGRYPTLNKTGFVADYREAGTTNPVVEKFLAWGEEKAQARQPWQPLGAQRYLVELAGGYGFLAQRAIEKKIFYKLNDANEAHLDIAREEVIVASRVPNQLHTFTATIPYDSTRFKSDLRHDHIAGIGCFMMFHFLRADEIRKALRMMFEALDPGGRVFLTMGTPFNGLFKGFPRFYLLRERNFLGAPSSQLPGEVEDAYGTLHLSPNHYPQFFHALTREIFQYLLQTSAGAEQFRVVEEYFIKRRKPKEQAYPRGYSKNRTELLGIILEKPAAYDPWRIPEI